MPEQNYTPGFVTGSMAKRLLENARATEAAVKKQWSEAAVRDLCPYMKLTARDSATGYYSWTEQAMNLDGTPYDKDSGLSGTPTWNPARELNGKIITTADLAAGFYVRADKANQSDTLGAIFDFNGASVTVYSPDGNSTSPAGQAVPVSGSVVLSSIAFTTPGVYILSAHIVGSGTSNVLAGSPGNSYCYVTTAVSSSGGLSRMMGAGSFKPGSGAGSLDPVYLVVAQNFFGAGVTTQGSITPTFFVEVADSSTLVTFTATSGGVVSPASFAYTFGAGLHSYGTLRIS